MCLITKSRLHGSPSWAETPLPMWFILIPQLLRDPSLMQDHGIGQQHSSLCLLCRPCQPPPSSDFVLSSLRASSLNTHFFRAWAGHRCYLMKLCLPQLLGGTPRLSCLLGRSFHISDYTIRNICKANFNVCAVQRGINSDLGQYSDIRAFPSHHRAAFAAKGRRCALSS